MTHIEYIKTTYNFPADVNLSRQSKFSEKQKDRGNK